MTPEDMMREAGFIVGMDGDAGWVNTSNQYTDYMRILSLIQIAQREALVTSSFGASLARVAHQAQSMQWDESARRFL